MKIKDYWQIYLFCILFFVVLFYVGRKVYIKKTYEVKWEKYRTLWYRAGAPLSGCVYDSSEKYGRLYDSVLGLKPSDYMMVDTVPTSAQLPCQAPPNRDSLVNAYKIRSEHWQQIFYSMGMPLHNGIVDSMILYADQYDSLLGIVPAHKWAHVIYPNKVFK